METIFLILFLGAIFIAILYFSRPSFSTRQKRLMNMYSSVISDMNLDHANNDIGSINIYNISQSIINFTSELEKMIPKIQEQSKDNKQWLTSLIKEFNLHLQIWLDRHADELQIMEDTIKKMKSTDLGHKAVLDLVVIRLENHNRILEKI
ncbi:hypothetical protein K2X92_05330 [Candidatus Gracilibacteria bacterium]|nr:hypothetical protein [Candidatus Gracilibacteria bacterium]